MTNAKIINAKSYKNRREIIKKELRVFTNKQRLIWRTIKSIKSQTMSMTSMT